MNNNNNSFSNNELRQNLQNTIKKSGILNEIKAHIRKDIILQLMTRENKNLRSLSHIKSDFHSRILQSIVHHYLQTNNLLKTISVFEAEFGIENHRNILSETEITDFLRLKYAIDDTDQVNTDGSILDKIVRSSMKEYNSTRREKELSFSTIHTESRQKHDNSEQALKQQISMISYFYLF